MKDKGVAYGDLVARLLYPARRLQPRPDIVPDYPTM